MIEMNAFDNNEQEIPEVKEQVIDPILEAEITKYRMHIKTLEDMGLYLTAEGSRRKLTRLLAQTIALEAPEG
jgi:hypothetical protein